MLEKGEFANISELATNEKLRTSFVAHGLRLTLLAPDIVEEILDGKQSSTLKIQSLMRGFPVEWDQQRNLT